MLDQIVSLRFSEFGQFFNSIDSFYNGSLLLFQLLKSITLNFVLFFPLKDNEKDPERAPTCWLTP